MVRRWILRKIYLQAYTKLASTTTDVTRQEKLERRSRPIGQSFGEEIDGGIKRYPDDTPWA